MELDVPIHEDDDEALEFPPDIIIPPPVFSPLPLQCLAAEALPDRLKREIEGVIAECSCRETATTEPQSGPERDSQVANGRRGATCACSCL